MQPTLVRAARSLLFHRKQPARPRPAIALDEASVPIRPDETALREGAFKNQREPGDWTLSYEQHPESARLDGGGRRRTLSLA
jgi:hypothetical protein